MRPGTEMFLNAGGRLTETGQISWKAVKYRLVIVDAQDRRRASASSPQSECTGCRQQGLSGSKTLHRQNPPVLNWRCRPTQVDVYNGRETVVVVVVVLCIFPLPSGGFRGCGLCGRTPLASFRKIQGLPVSKIVRTADSTIIIITNFYLAAGSHEIFLRVGGREGMKGLGALQRHQLPPPPCKNPGSATAFTLYCRRAGALNLATYIGIAAGAVVFIALAVAVVFFVTWRVSSSTASAKGTPRVAASPAGVSRKPSTYRTRFVPDDLYRSRSRSSCSVYYNYHDDTC